MNLADRPLLPALVILCGSFSFLHPLELLSALPEHRGARLILLVLLLLHLGLHPLAHRANFHSQSFRESLFVRIHARLAFQGPLNQRSQSVSALVIVRFAHFALPDQNRASWANASVTMIFSVC